MSATRLMTYGVYALGALMVVVGLFFVSHGVPIVRMELGWTQIVGGSVAASAGCIVMVMGLVLHHLDAMRDTVERLALPLPAVPSPISARAPALAPESGAATTELRPLHPLAPALKRDWPFAEAEEVRPEPALTAALHPAALHADEVQAIAEPAEPEPEPLLVQSAPALVLAENEEGSQGPAVIAPDAVADPLAETPAAASRPNYLASFLARRPTGPSTPTQSAEPLPLPLSLRSESNVAGGRPLIPSRRTSIDLSSGWDEDAAAREPPSPEAPDAVAAEPEPEPPALHDPEPVEEPAPAPDQDDIAAAEADPMQPVVVGRYNAGAASYIMYSNGMIEVETEQGTHQFASMQDLKTFIERRDAQVS